MLTWGLSHALVSSDFTSAWSCDAPRFRTQGQKKHRDKRIPAPLLATLSHPLSAGPPLPPTSDETHPANV